MERKSIITKVEEISGYLLKEEDQNSVDDLNETPSHIISIAQKMVHIIDQLELFWFLTPRSNHYILRSFIKDVIENKEPVDTWEKGRRILLPDISFEDRLTTPLSQIMPNGLPHTHLVLPRYSAWEQASCIGGCPVIIDENGTYKSPPIPKMHNYANVKISPKSDFNEQVMHARWIAQIVARYFKFHTCIHFPSLKEMKTELKQFAPKRRWIPEVELALNGLIKEIEAGMIEPNKVPGFIGPDAFYS
jgi:hypothetical protein